MINLIPYPNGVVRDDGKIFLFEGAIKIINEEFDPYCYKVFLERTGLKEGNGKLTLTLQKDVLLKNDEYFLEIKRDGIKVSALNERGIIYGLTSAYLLYEESSFPSVSFHDYPARIWRSMSLDCVRHFFKKEEVMKIIENNSLVKMNVLHLVLSNDQGYRIESKLYPKLNEISKDYYSFEDIKEIIEYARLRGMDIMPEIDIPGHTTALLSAYPDLGCTGENIPLPTLGGVYNTVLCLGKESTLKFIDNLIKEVVPLFPFEYFHIGGDEVPHTRWKKCPNCEAKMKEWQVSTFDDYQGKFLSRMHYVLRSLKKKPICWNDVLLSKKITPEKIIQYWTLGYQDEMNEFVEKGGKFIYSDMFEYYLDYPYSMTPLKKMYETNPHIGRYEITNYNNMLGYEACVWTERIDTEKHLEEMIYPRIFALAAIAWREEKLSYDCFKKRLIHLKSKLKNTTITPYSWWDPKGPKRRDEAINYFKLVNSQTINSEYTDNPDAKTNKEVTKAYITKFFKPLDIPKLYFVNKKIEKQK